MSEMEPKKPKKTDQHDINTKEVMFSCPNPPPPPLHFDHDYGQTRGNSKELSQKLSYNLLGSPMIHCIDEISTTDDEESWLFTCSCNKCSTTGPVICCNVCKTWGHTECAGLSNNNTFNDNNNYTCQSCCSKKPSSSPPASTCKHSTAMTTCTHMSSGSSDPLTPTNSKKHRPPCSPSTLDNKHYDESSNGFEPSSSRLLQASISSSKESHGSDNGVALELECDCLSRVKEVLGSLPFNYDMQVYNKNTRSRNCFSFTLKNGQKILKSARTIESGSFICDLKFSVHVFGICSRITSSYNAYSSFFFTMNLNSMADIAVDTRNYNHFSRYIRRSCCPNAKIACTLDPKNHNIVRVFLYSLKEIQRSKEITIAVDRTIHFFNKYPSKAIKHHWQKYDYLSCLICQCSSSPAAPAKSNADHCEAVPHMEEQQHMAMGITERTCSVHSVKLLLEKIKNSSKRMQLSTSRVTTLPKESSENSDVSDQDLAQPKALIEPGKRLTREERKIEYWLHVINRMEKEPKGKKHNQEGRDEAHGHEAAAATSTTCERRRRARTTPKKKSHYRESDAVATPCSSSQLNSLSDSKATEAYSPLNSTACSEKVSANLQAQSRSESPVEESWYFPDQLHHLVFESSGMLKKLVGKHRNMGVPLTNHSSCSSVPMVLNIRRCLLHRILEELHSGNTKDGSSNSACDLMKFFSSVSPDKASSNNNGLIMSSYDQKRSPMVKLMPYRKRRLSYLTLKYSSNSLTPLAAGPEPASSSVVPTTISMMSSCINFPSLASKLEENGSASHRESLPKSCHHLPSSSCTIHSGFLSSPTKKTLFSPPHNTLYLPPVCDDSHLFSGGTKFAQQQRHQDGT